MIESKLYKEALLIRRVEERLFRLFSEAKVAGTIHACIGQEFSALAFNACLSPKDMVISNHRCHGHFIARTNNYQALIAELIGKKTGVCAGVGSSQHLFSENFLSNGVQGGMVPVSAGLALANKFRGSGNMVVVYIGDGTLGEGVVYETMNLISLWKVPLLIVCENNYYAQSTAQKNNLSGDILKRPEAFGIKTFKADIWDLKGLFSTAQESINYVREKMQPAFCLIETYRLYPHSKSDDNRNNDEIEKYKKIDPLNVFAAENPAIFKDFSDQIDAQVEAVVNEQLSQPELTLDDYWTIHTNGAGASILQDIETVDMRQVELINDFFDKAMEKDKSIIFMGEDILSPYGGAFKAARGLSDKYPDRVLTTPISEGAITGTANGLALAGFKPFVEIMFGDFMTLTMDQIINHASKFHHMYYKQINCPVVIRTPMGGRRGYGPTHSQTLDKFLVGIDNVTTIALNSLIDPRIIYSAVLKEKHPVVVIENKGDYSKKIAKTRIKNYTYQRTSGDYPVALIKPQSSSANATIVTYGGMAEVALEALQPLFFELELKPEIIVLSKIHPIDYREILESVSRTKKLYVMEEGSAFAGLGAEIIASVQEQSKEKIIARRIAALPVPIPSVRSLEDKVLPNVESIIRIISESLL
jgi:2-oxoisovalerate dehydrogenase E1 component